MNEYSVIDKATWPRRDMFDFYRTFANSCFNVSVSLEAAALHASAKERGASFFLLALYAILRAANTVPQLRQRVLEDGRIVEFTTIAAMTPIMTGQDMFSQVWCDYAPTFAAFERETAPRVQAAAQGSPSLLYRHGENFLCASCLPWLHFTAVSQADFYFGQAVPILAWGKLKNGCVPVSCKFSHEFVDGLHVSRFFGQMEESFANPHSLWSPLP